VSELGVQTWKRSFVATILFAILASVLFFFLFQNFDVAKVNIIQWVIFQDFFLGIL
jgi:hypothetical protein